MVNYMTEYRQGRMSADVAYVNVVNLLSDEVRLQNMNCEELRAYSVQREMLAYICANRYVEWHGWVHNPDNAEYVQYVRIESV